MRKRPTWPNSSKIESRRYTCAHCQSITGSATGFAGNVEHSSVGARIYICQYCNEPTYFDYLHTQTPGPSFAASVDNLPDDVQSLYNEARRVMTVNAFASSVICCRKILMNIAVQQGADEGMTFLEYLEFLKKQGHITPRNFEWVDHIREIGNFANHEIKAVTEDDAKTALTFTEMLLKTIYEYPNIVASRNTSE